MTDQDDKLAARLREFLSTDAAPPVGIEARAAEHVVKAQHRRRLVIGLVSGLSIAAAVGAAAFAIAVTHQRPVAGTRPAATNPPPDTLSPFPSQSASPNPLVVATPTSSAAPRGCAAHSLSATGVFGAGAGNDGFAFTLTNRSSSSCTVSGYLTLADADPRGPALVVQHGSSMLYTDRGPRNITLVPGGSGYFAIGYSEGSCSNGPSFAAISVRFSTGDSLVLPIGAWRQTSSGKESICDGFVDETAVSLQLPSPGP